MYWLLPLLFTAWLEFAAGADKGRTEFVLSPRSMSYVLHRDQFIAKEKITLIGCNNCTFSVLYATVHCDDEIGDKTPGIRCYDPIPFNINDISLHPRTCTVIWASDTSPDNLYDAFVYQCAYEFTADQLIAEYKPKTENQSIFAISFKVVEWEDPTILAEYLVPQGEAADDLGWAPKQFSVAPNTAVTFVTTTTPRNNPPHFQGVVLNSDCSFDAYPPTACLNMMYEGSVPGHSFASSYFSNNAGHVIAFTNALTLVQRGPKNDSVTIVYDFIRQDYISNAFAEHQWHIVLPPNYLWEFAEFQQPRDEPFFFTLEVNDPDLHYLHKFRTAFYLNRLEGGVIQYRNAGSLTPVNMTGIGPEMGVKDYLTDHLEFTFFPNDAPGKRGYLLLLTGVIELVPQFDAVVQLDDGMPVYLLNVHDIYNGHFNFFITKNQTADEQFYATGCIVGGPEDYPEFNDDPDTYTQNLTYITLKCQRSAQAFEKYEHIPYTVYNDTVKGFDSLTLQLVSSLQADFNYYTVPLTGGIDKQWQLVPPKDDAKDSLLVLSFTRFDRSSFWMIEDIAWAHSSSTCDYIMYPYAVSEKKNLTTMSIFSDEHSFAQQIVLGGSRSIFIPRGCMPTVSVRHVACDFTHYGKGYTVQQCQGVTVLTAPDYNDFLLNPGPGTSYTVTFWCDLHIDVTVRIPVCEDALLGITPWNNDTAVTYNITTLQCLPTIKFKPLTWFFSNITRFEFTYETSGTQLGVERTGQMYAEIRFDPIVPKKNETPHATTTMTALATSGISPRLVTVLRGLATLLLASSLRQ